MSLATQRPSRPVGVVKHTIVHPDGSKTIRTIRTDSRGVTRRASITMVTDPAR